MAGVRLTVAVKTNDTKAYLKKLATKLRDPDAILTVAAGTIRDSVYENFAEGGRPNSWAPLSPVTLKRRKSSGGILVVRGGAGGLEGSINIAVEGGKAYVGTNAIHAAVHQFGAAKGAFGKSKRGGPIPWGNIPARPFLVVQPGDEARIKADVETYWAAL
jgi:phage virion morphogenesis protein